MEPPPVMETNLYLRDVPPFIVPRPPAPAFKGRAESLIERAEQLLQTGRRHYQAEETEEARKAFDEAIDVMVSAAELPVVDRPAYEDRLDKMVEAINRYDLAGLGAAATPDEAQYEKAPLEDILGMTFPVDPKLKSRVREQLRATASQLPLSINDSVLGYIHYFLGRGHKTLMAGLERAGRYQPMIQRILDEEGVPQELIHLAQAESGFLPRAVSRMSAAGMWQFMAFRGQQYGLGKTPYLDERLDPEKATRAAARHLHDLFEEFGDWYLAIAAYNCGPGVIEKAVERTGYADFWELRERRVLPAETTNYVPIILAMTILAKNTGEYGLDKVQPDAPVAYDTVTLAAPTSLALVADLTEAPVTELMSLNPAVLKGTAPQGYALHIPKGAVGTLTAALDMVPPERRASWRVHTVAGGETLASIGKRYRASARDIAAANRLASAEPVAGDRLVIPAAYTEGKTATRKSATNASARRRPAARRHSVSASRAGKTGTGVHASTAAQPPASTVVTRTASTVRRTSARSN
jgi:membrane-bound lytic murein transglycosylase D